MSGQATDRVVHTPTAPVSETQEVMALRRDLEELRQRVEQLEGESRQSRQQIAFLKGRLNYAEVMA